MSDISPAPKAVVAFGRRNASEERIRQAEEEIEQLRNPVKQEAVQEAEESDEGLSAEEKSFKKRYGDLRRYSQKQLDEMQKKVDELTQQLNSATKQEMRLPKTQEELDAWAKEYPDVYKLVKTIAIQQAQEQTTGIEERLKKIDEMERNAAREKAEAELMRLHPDFDEIRDQDEFHAWVEDQPSWVQQALYENDNDARAAARAIDLYKADKGIKTKKSNSDREAASAITTRRTRSTPNGEGTEGLIYESQIAKMSTADYERNAQAINDAIKAGKFVYDMSGAAR